METTEAQRGKTKLVIVRGLEPAGLALFTILKTKTVRAQDHRQ